MRLIFVVLFCTNLVFIASQSRSCRNPSDKAGTCVPISACPQLHRILGTAPIDIASIRFLQLSATSCGSRQKNSGGGDDEYDEATVCCVHETSTLSNVTPQQQNSTSNVVKPIGSVTSVENAGPANVADVNLFVNASEEAKLKIHPNFGLLPQPSDCGIGRKPKAVPAVIGGTDTTLGKYPWMALLGIKEEGYEDVQYACGGAIINRRYILTAAHCNQFPSGYNFELSTIRIGEFDTNTTKDCDGTECAPPTVDIPIEQIIMHEEYSPNGHEHDIALIRLSQNIELNGFVSPVCLPLTSLTHKGSPTVAGWGRTRADSESSATILQELEVPLTSHQSCNDLYKQLLRTEDIGIGRFCAGGDLLKNSCQGDSGGPLMVSSNNNSSQLYQIGIVSQGPKNCGTVGAPALYTKVSMYINWILDNIKP